MSFTCSTFLFLKRRSTRETVQYAPEVGHKENLHCAGHYCFFYCDVTITLIRRTVRTGYKG